MALRLGRLGRLRRAMFFDIGANLTDDQFQGVYRGKQRHPADLDAVLARAREQNVTKILVTGSDLKESLAAQKLAAQHPGFLYATMGVHPCQAADAEVAETGYFDELQAWVTKGAKDGTIKAFGEFGLDYDRLHYAPADKQREVFEKQLAIAAQVKLPLFLHSRACAEDFYALLAPVVREHKLSGVVHSFTGTVAEMLQLVDLGMYIGVNGCSLKTEENLEVVRQIPLSHIMLETDAPWCEMRRTHAGVAHVSLESPYDSVPKPERWRAGALVRGRCEPCLLPQVAEVVAAVRSEPLEVIAKAAYQNSLDLFRI